MSITAKLASGAARSLTGPRERAGSASAATINAELNATTIAILVIGILTYICNGSLSSYVEMVQTCLVDAQHRISCLRGAANHPRQASAWL